MSSPVLDILVTSIITMDFNIREQSESLWTPNPDVSLELDLFLQEIDILFSIAANTVLGKRELGLSIEHLLWSTDYSNDFVSSRIYEKIEKNCFSGQNFSWTVDTEILRGTSRDIGVITVSIKTKSKDSTLAEQKYVFK